MGSSILTGREANGNTELWRSDGTEAGTMLLKEIHPGADDYDRRPENLTIANGLLFFSADDGLNRLWWKSDGTTDGTIAVSTTGPFSPAGLVAMDGFVYSASGNTLWKSDGTPAGTSPIASFTAVLPSQVAPLKAVASTLYFGVTGSEGFYELWASDGTSAGTRLLQDLAQGNMFFGISLTTPLNGALLFTPVRYQAGSLFELWRSDGTAAGTRLVKAFPNTNADPTFTDNYVVHNGQLFFRLESAEGLELWQSDGSEAGTQQVMLVTPDLADFSDEQLGIKAIGSQIFFTAAGNERGAELWTAPAPSSLPQWLILTLFIQ